MPKSLEAYYQEDGRAGRDGEPADCLLLYSPGDVQTAKFLIQSSGENEELTDAERSAVIEQDMKRLQVMIGYCKTTDCLRGYILGYFGQAHPAHGGVLLTDQAGAVLFHRESAFMTTRTPLAAEKKCGKKERGCGACGQQPV